MSDRQFKAASFDGFGLDWPITYADLQPYYDEAERFLEVCGIAANLDEIPDGVFSPTQLSAPAQTFKEAIRLEWPDRHVTALRRARSEYLGQRSRASHRAAAPADDIRFPSCSAGTALAAAASTARLTLRTNSIVSRVICDRGGRRALGVEYVDCHSGATREEAWKGDHPLRLHH